MTASRGRDDGGAAQTRGDLGAATQSDLSATVRRAFGTLTPAEAISLLESAPAYFYLADPEDASTRYRSPQAVAMLGYSLEEWAAAPDLWQELLHPDDRERVLAEYRAAGRGDCRFRTDYRIRDKSGRYRWMRDHAELVPSPDGGGRVVQGVVLDITDQKLAEAAAAEARVESAAKTRFLAAMSHELRTPLNSILGFAQMLNDPALGGELSERQRRYVENIAASGRHLLELVNDVLDMARLDSQRVELTLVAVDVGEAAAEALSAIRPLARPKALELAAAIPDGLRVRADRRRLHQVLLNLLSNAVKFTDRGRVSVSAAAEGPMVAISVADTGIGIPKNALEAIFDEFAQVDRGLRRAFEGTGLGLALTRRYVELMEGRVGVESRPGVGSTFTVRLPAA